MYCTKVHIWWHRMLWCFDILTFILANIFYSHIIAFLRNGVHRTANIIFVLNDVTQVANKISMNAITNGQNFCLVMEFVGFQILSLCACAYQNWTVCMGYGNVRRFFFLNVSNMKSFILGGTFQAMLKIFCSNRKNGILPTYSLVETFPLASSFV